jgi:homopolymeric O-antigen transport system ATP-binding protein
VTSSIAIRAEGLSKRYLLGVGSRQHDSIRELLSGLARSLSGSYRRPEVRSEFFALKGASFEIACGESVGIIGSNGAGKSTLLKILSRITQPTTGRALIRGRVGALLEVGTGFHQELTGRENIHLYGAILGMGSQEINAKFDAIVDFAEIEKFIDTPVKRYSSGMYVRLAFAVAAHLRPDILLLDEVLAVGDAAFQRKCVTFARDLQRQHATILFVSHNMFSIKAMCSRVIYLKSGKIEFDGPTDAGIEMYEKGSHLSVVPWCKEDPGNWSVVISDVELTSEDGTSKSVFDFGERMIVRIRFSARDTIRSPNFMVAFVRSDGVGCTVYTNEADDFDIDQLKGSGAVEIRMPALKLVAEKYVVHVLIRKRGTQDLLCAQVGQTFHVRHPLLDMDYGVFHERAEWRIIEHPQSHVA